MRGQYWLEAPEMTGPWKVNRRLPEDFFRLPDNARLHEVRKRVRGRRWKRSRIRPRS